MSPSPHSRFRRLATRAIGAGLVLATAVATVATAQPHAPIDAGEPTPPGLEEQLAQHGVQQSAKHEPSAAAIAGTEPARGANPYLSSTPSENADYHYWDTLLAARAAARAAEQQMLVAAVPVIDESEPDTLRGRNETLATGELVAMGAAPSDVRVLGTLADAALPPPP